MIDALALGIHLRPLYELMANYKEVMKVFHAGRQVHRTVWHAREVDLRILIFDMQVAA